jgi:hypothetical protein
MLSREFDGKSRERIIEIALAGADYADRADAGHLGGNRADASCSRQNSNRREVEAAGEQYRWSTPQQRLIYADDSFESLCRAWE